MECLLIGVHGKVNVHCMYNVQGRFHYYPRPHYVHRRTRKNVRDPSQAYIPQRRIYL